MFQFGTTPGDIEEEEPDPGEWNVERILAHRFVIGRPEFLTKWEGAAPWEETWELIGNFVHRYSYKLAVYCKNKVLSFDLVEYLSSSPLVVYK
jgi:hypothetical protein